MRCLSPRRALSPINGERRDERGREERKECGGGGKKRRPQASADERCNWFSFLTPSARPDSRGSAPVQPPRDCHYAKKNPVTRDRTGGLGMTDVFCLVRSIVGDISLSPSVDPSFLPRNAESPSTFLLQSHALSRLSYHRIFAIFQERHRKTIFQGYIKSRDSCFSPFPPRPLFSFIIFSFLFSLIFRAHRNLLAASGFVPTPPPPRSPPAPPVSTPWSRARTTSAASRARRRASPVTSSRPKWPSPWT